VTAVDFSGMYSKACEGNASECLLLLWRSLVGHAARSLDRCGEACWTKGYSFAEARASVQSTIPLNLANEYANLLPQNEAQRAFQRRKTLPQ